MSKSYESWRWISRRNCSVGLRINQDHDGLLGYLEQAEKTSGFPTAFTPIVEPSTLISEVSSSKRLTLRLIMQSVFPASREKLWSVLRVHVEDDLIGKIHPRILSQRQVSKDGNSWILQRRVHNFGKTFNLKMRVEMAPPEMYRWEIIESDGGVEPGSYVENHYEDAGEGTAVKTTAEMTPRGVPGFLHKWVVNRGLDGADKEDLLYLTKMLA